VTDLLERTAIISGAGISQTGRRIGRSGLDLALEASLSAIADAGLSVDDIDGIASMGESHPDDVKDSLGLELAWMAPAGGQGAGGHLRYVVLACMAVATGLCRHVLVYRSVSMFPGLFSGGPVGAGEWQLPFHSYSAANTVALHLRRHMHLYGTTKEQLGALSVTQRAHAGLNEKATLREPITMDDYLNAPWICEPLSLLDCDIPIDGAVAVIVSAADYAGDGPNPPVRFEAVGTAARGRMSWDQRDDYPAMGHVDSARHMWSRTDLKPADVDVLEIYDGFTILTLLWLEALGFCNVGEGGPFVEGGERIRLGGSHPLNTYGGQLSAGRLHGYWLLYEAVLQLQGKAGARQVPNAEVAIAAAGGGPNTGCLLLTR
jgi:acetyl-CoA acetyltransferase